MKSLSESILSKTVNSKQILAGSIPHLPKWIPAGLIKWSMEITNGIRTILNQESHPEYEKYLNLSIQLHSMVAWLDSIRNTQLGRLIETKDDQVHGIYLDLMDGGDLCIRFDDMDLEVQKEIQKDLDRPPYNRIGDYRIKLHPHKMGRSRWLVVKFSER